ncbi:unnamed protein product [Musa acuminata var. zebrina]
MADRRKPLVLSSTRALLDSVLGSAGSQGVGDGAVGAEGEARGAADRRRPELRLPVGILRFSDSGGVGSDELKENFFVVGLSASVLKKLAIASGSLILLKNSETNVGRIAKAKVLQHPLAGEKYRGCTQQATSVSSSQRVMKLLPSFTYPSEAYCPSDQEVAYVTPLLAFNLGLHISCLKVLVRSGQESLTSLFEVEEHREEKETNYHPLFIDLISWPDLPKYATHLRISFVKIPECGLLGSLRGKSATEEGDRQDMIDLALNEYFKVDKFLARGDVFYIRLDWNCSSEMCVFCNQKSPKGLSSNIVYFKVMSMEPSDEPILCVNCNQTALVLGGSAASSIPPDRFIGSSNDFMPLHVETVKKLTSILAPAICPSVLLSRFRVSVFLSGNPGCGKRTVVRYVAQCLGLHVVEYSCYDLTESSDKKASAALTNAFKSASRYSPCLLLLRHFDVFTNLSSNEGSRSDQVGITSEIASVIREFTEPLSENEDSYPGKMANDASFLVEAEKLNSRVFLVAAAGSSDGLQPQIRRCFSHEISMSPLNEAQRISMLSRSLRGSIRTLDKTIGDEFLKDIVSQTSGFMPRDIHALVADAGANFVQRTLTDGGKSENGDFSEITATDLASIQDEDNSHDYANKHIEKEDFSKALERSKKRNASALGAPKVPNVKWEDVGGLEEVKKSILDTVQLPLLHKDLFSSGLRKRSGVLLYGPPGTGKTLLAKAVATECSLNFLSVKGPELINMYIGESEKNVRDIFQKARAARPCVIFFDELDSLAPARGASGDSGGVMDRVVSQMLAEIDGLNDSSQDLFIIGASNRPDLIDPALLRPGRFDKLLYVGVNTDASYRERVLKALTRKFKLDKNVSLFSVARKCPPNFTGADMYALCADAWFRAAKRKTSSDGSNPTIDDKADSVIVEINDFMKVLGDLAPSLSMDELKKYERLREQFEGFFCSYENVPAGAAETMRSISHPSIRVTTGGSRQKRVGGRGRWNSTSSGRCFRVRTRVTPPAKKEKATWAGPATGAGSATCRRSPGNVNDRNNQQLGGRPALRWNVHGHRTDGDYGNDTNRFHLSIFSPSPRYLAPEPSTSFRVIPTVHAMSHAQQLNDTYVGAPPLFCVGFRFHHRESRSLFRWEQRMSPYPEYAYRSVVPSKSHTALLSPPHSATRSPRFLLSLRSFRSRSSNPLTLFDLDRCFAFVWISIIGGEMKRLIRRLSRVADSSHDRPLQAAKGGPRRVPEGHVPLCVGEEMERFAVRAELLGRPALVELLRRSAQEYGYEQQGVLRIPCPVPLFCRLLLLSSSSSSAAAADPALEELFRSLPDEGWSFAA